MSAKALQQYRYPADGFKEDCLALLSKFGETKSARFSDFLKVWQEMKFSLIYCGLNSFAELLEFTEEALGIAKTLFLPPNSDISRIGALYLVYGVYTQQPTRGLVKIRMTPLDWVQSMEFIANVREYGYADANYIFHLLCYQAAFIFTAYDKQYGLERSYRRHQITSTHFKEMMQCRALTSSQLLKPVFQNLDVDEIESLRINYENAKKQITAKEENQGMEFTSVTPLEDTVTTLKKVAAQFLPNEALSETQDLSNTEVDPGSCAPSTSKMFMGKNVGENRHLIKEKAFSKITSGQNHLKSCVPASESTAASEPVVMSPEENPNSGEDVPRKRKTPKNIFRAELVKKPKVKNPSTTESDCEDDDNPDDPCSMSSDNSPQSTKQEPVRKSSRTTVQPGRFSDYALGPKSINFL